MFARSCRGAPSVTFTRGLSDATRRHPDHPADPASRRGVADLGVLIGVGLRPVRYPRRDRRDRARARADGALLMANPGRTRPASLGPIDPDEPPMPQLFPKMRRELDTSGYANTD